jgi:transposase, IS5 family
MIKKNEKGVVTFADVWLDHTETRWQDHWMKKVLDKIKWNKFGYRLEKLYTADNGRPGWDPLVLFRCLILAQWYGLSDRQLEEAVEFRIDFRKFAGLRFEEEAPDATTFAVFRERILPIYDKLLKILNAQLEAAGLKIKEVVAVDATLVEAHSIPQSDFLGDEEASWRGFPARELIDGSGHKVIARRPALYGYKINLAATVGTGFISALSVCRAAEHESKHLAKLLSGKTKKVLADKGYYGCKKLLKSLAIKDKIQDKGFRNRPLTKAQLARNKKIAAPRVIVEGVFGSWKQWYGWIKTKYCGLEKNCLAATITAISWNMKKFALSSA